MITSQTSSGSSVKNPRAPEADDASLDDLLGISPADAHVGQRLSELMSVLQTAYLEERDRCGLLHREIAKRLDTDPSEISHILSGRRNISVRKLAYLLHSMNRDFLVQAPPLAASDRPSSNSVVSLTTEADTGPARSVNTKDAAETKTPGRAAAFAVRQAR